MAWELIDLPLASMLAATVFFTLVGILVLFTDDLELKLVIGVGAILIGASVLLVAVDLHEIALLLVAVLAALAVKQVLEHFSVY